MQEFIKHVPLYVFVIFIALVILGYQQSRDHIVSFKRALIVPLFMVFFSLYSVISPFGINASLLMWLFGMMLMSFLGIRIKAFYHVIYLQEQNAFALKGSWIWFVAMMLIFWIKFIVGVIIARELLLFHELSFSLGIGFLYGCLSGIFVARAMILRRLQQI